MPGFELKYNVRRFDHRAFTKSLEKHIEQVLRESMRVFLRSVALGLPVWTGRAKKSLAPLAHSLHIAWNISPVASAYEQGRNSPQSSDITTPHWKDAIQRTGYVWSVSLGSGVFYFDVNEVMNVNASFGFHLKHPGPWNLFKKGSEAANDYMRAHLHTGMPKASRFITLKPMKISYHI